VTGTVLRAAAVQLQSGDDVSLNLERVRHWTARAAHAGARLVLLPENFAFFGAEVDKRCRAESLETPGPIGAALRGLASEFSVHVIAGGFAETSADPARPFNTAAVFDPTGELVARYRKMHLFDVTLPDGAELQESAGTMPGDAPVVVDVDGFRIGLSICYDLRFSALFTALGDAGAEILVVPAAFTAQTGKDHWRVLLQARAIEWQSWVVAAAQWGSHPNHRRTHGHSLIADPWGTVVCEASDREGFVVADLDLEYLRQVRARLPCGSHRRKI
jgi:predicted amidohydrolase